MFLLQKCASLWSVQLHYFIVCLYMFRAGLRVGLQRSEEKQSRHYGQCGWILCCPVSECGGCLSAVERGEAVRVIMVVTQGVVVNVCIMVS